MDDPQKIQLRSPRESVGGYAVLPRLIDKARLLGKGRFPQEHLTNEELLAWIQTHAKPATVEGNSMDSCLLATGPMIASLRVASECISYSLQ